MYTFFFPLQSLGDGQGDKCEDYDGDGYPDNIDVCPENPHIHTTDLRTFQTVVLDPEGTEQVDPRWIVFDEVNKSAQMHFVERRVWTLMFCRFLFIGRNFTF